MNNRIRFTAFCSFSVLASLLFPICHLTYFNIKDIGIEFIDTNLFAVLLSIFVFFLTFIIYHKKSIPIISPIFYTLLYTSLVNTFFLPNKLTVVDGTDPLKFVIRQEARYTFLIILGLFILLGIKNKNSTIKSLNKNITFASKLLVTLSILFTGFVFYHLPKNKKTGIMNISYPKPSSSIQLGKRNILIISFDQVQGSAFNGYLNSERGQRHRKLFEGFSLYPNAVSTYPNTKYSLLSIFLGRAVTDNEKGRIISTSPSPNIFLVAQSKGIHTHTGLPIRRYLSPKINYFDRQSSPHTLPAYIFNIAFGIDITGILPKSYFGELSKYKLLLDSNIFKDHFWRAITYDKQIRDTLYFFHFTFSHQPFLVDSKCQPHTMEQLKKITINRRIFKYFRLYSIRPGKSFFKIKRFGCI